MKLYQMVAKDVARRKRRVLYAALGVAIGTMTVVAILTISVSAETRIYGQLEKYGANLTIMPAISSVGMTVGDLSLGNLTVGDNYIPENMLPQIRQIADGEIREALKIKDEGDIAVLAPKLYVNTQVKGTSVMVVGVDPGEENKIKTWWMVRQGDYLTSGDQAVVGAMAAELLSLNVGDKVALNGGEVSVRGILGETGSNDDYQLFVPIGTLQKAFGKEGLLSAVDMRALCNACPVEVIADALHKDIPALRAVAVKQIAETEMGMVEKISKFLLALAGITLMVGAFGVVNTMLASVQQRIKDIGIMRAVGASRRQIMLAFVYEAAMVGVAGGVLGYLAGTGLAYLVGPLIFEGTGITYVPRFIPLALGLALLVAAVASVYPAMQATRIKVADAFRSL